MLQTRGLKYRYSGSEEMSFPDINCTEGSHWLMLGSSGSGKTTLLHLMAGLMPPTEGRINIQDQEITKLSTRALDRFRGQHIGLILQQPHLIQSLSIAQNIKAAAYFAGTKITDQRLNELLEDVGIQHKFHSLPKELSQGERQRVGIARAIVNRPRLILADEPTSALDDENTNKVMSLLKREAQNMNAILMIVTHDNRLKSHFDHQIVLS